MVKSLFEPEVDVIGFFEDALRAAAASRGVDPEAASSKYAAGLLAQYARPGALSGEALRRPLTLLLREALEGFGPERFQRLRGLGDQVLYLSGFFADHLDSRGVERRFVRGLGATAYDAAGAMLRRRGGDSQGPDVFDELATHFDELADVLGDVADALHGASARDSRSIVELYERWTRRESPALAAALARAGVVPTRGGRTVH